MYHNYSHCPLLTEPSKILYFIAHYFVHPITDTNSLSSSDLALTCFSMVSCISIPELQVNLPELPLMIIKLVMLGIFMMLECKWGPFIVRQ
jgi:hypothetical protein